MNERIGACCKHEPECSPKVTVCRGCHYEIGLSGGCATWGCDGVAHYGTKEIDRLTYQLFVSRRPRPEAPKAEVW